MPDERRRARNCPSCGGKEVLRGNRIDGWAITVPARQGQVRGMRLAPFSDVCLDCGMVTLYVRIAEAK